MGRPMLVPPRFAALGPTEKLIPRPICFVVETRGIERALSLLCCSPRARLAFSPAYSMIAWPVWGNSKYAVVP